MCFASKGSGIPQSNVVLEILTSFNPSLTRLMISLLLCFGDKKFGFSL